MRFDGDWDDEPIIRIWYDVYRGIMPSAPSTLSDSSG